MEYYPERPRKVVRLGCLYALLLAACFSAFLCLSLSSASLPLYLIDLATNRKGELQKYRDSISGLNRHSAVALGVHSNVRGSLSFLLLRCCCAAVSVGAGGSSISGLNRHSAVALGVHSNVRCRLSFLQLCFCCAAVLLLCCAALLLCSISGLNRPSAVALGVHSSVRESLSFFFLVVDAAVVVVCLSLSCSFLSLFSKR
jgi:hypothetical protein